MTEECEYFTEDVNEVEGQKKCVEPTRQRFYRCAYFNDGFCLRGGE